MAGSLSPADRKAIERAEAGARRAAYNPAREFPLSSLTAAQEESERVATIPADKLAVWALERYAAVRDEWITKAVEFLAYLRSPDGLRVYPSSGADMIARWTADMGKHARERDRYRRLAAWVRGHGMPGDNATHKNRQEDLF